jgi:allantoin racemase
MQDKAEAIVLGCAGMAALMHQLSEEFGIPVIDGISCAVGMAEALVSAGLSTSKVRTYAAATDKRTSGQSLRAVAATVSAE